MLTISRKSIWRYKNFLGKLTKSRRIDWTTENLTNDGPESADIRKANLDEDRRPDERRFRGMRERGSETHNPEEIEQTVVDQPKSERTANVPWVSPRNMDRAGAITHTQAFGLSVGWGRRPWFRAGSM